MTEPPTWPPSPSTPEPLSAHDDFLSACVRNSTPKPPLSRLRLVQDLRQETGQDLRSCRIVVNSFCDNHAILMPDRSLGAWLALFISVFSAVIIFSLVAVQEFLQHRQDKAVTNIEKLVLSNERLYASHIFDAALLLNILLTLIFIWFRQKKAKADAAEAVAKFTR